MDIVVTYGWSLYALGFVRFGGLAAGVAMGFEILVMNVGFDMSPNC